jgi:hypothetical protein
LDGQQRTTSLLTSLYGGKIDGRDDFDPTLYVDLTIESDSETDDESYKKRFLFRPEIDDNRSAARKENFSKGLIVKIYDILLNYNDVSTEVFEILQPKYGQSAFTHQYMEELKKNPRHS